MVLSHLTFLVFLGPFNASRVPVVDDEPVLIQIERLKWDLPRDAIKKLQKIGATKALPLLVDELLRVEEEDAWSMARGIRGVGAKAQRKHRDTLLREAQRLAEILSESSHPVSRKVAAALSLGGLGPTVADQAELLLKAFDAQPTDEYHLAAAIGLTGFGRGVVRPIAPQLNERFPRAAFTLFVFARLGKDARDASKQMFALLNDHESRKAYVLAGQLARTLKKLPSGVRKELPEVLAARELAEADKRRGNPLPKEIGKDLKQQEDWVRLHYAGDRGESIYKLQVRVPPTLADLNGDGEIYRDEHIQQLYTFLVEQLIEISQEIEKDRIESYEAWQQQIEGLAGLARAVLRAGGR